MQDIRERERESLEIVDQTQTLRYFSRFEPLLYAPAFTQKDFHYVNTGPPTKRISTEEFTITNSEYTTPLSNTITFTQEARHKAKTQSPLHKRDRHKAKPQSPLHKRDKHKAKSQPHHPYTRGIGTKQKQRKDYNLDDHNRSQIIFLTKTRSYK